MKIFTPEDAAKVKTAHIPEYVFQAFNELLAERYDWNCIEIPQDQVVNRILRLSSSEVLTRHDIFDNRWLDVEDIYEANGWSVEYDKPGFNESYKPFFKFRPKKV